MGFASTAINRDHRDRGDYLGNLFGAIFVLIIRRYNKKCVYGNYD